ncbi:hypothetical protein [Streptosporangium saharense]|uniref:hypothetical protein n=1 Tax=Streptosporangium saharense TaxID=1706840 RepID=UPI003441AF05
MTLLAEYTDLKDGGKAMLGKSGVTTITLPTGLRPRDIFPAYLGRASRTPREKVAAETGFLACSAKTRPLQGPDICRVRTA